MQIHNSAKVGTKKPRTMPGLKVCRRQEIRSVPRDDRATEAVIDARSDHIYVLTDRVGAEYAAGRDASQNACRCEGDAAVTHEKVIVLDRNRPIRCESEFEARSDDTTPACFTRRIEQRACSGHRTSVFVVGNGRAALHIPKDVVPSIADLAGEQAERFNLGIVSPSGNEKANIRSLQISPVALRFQTEHPTGALPTVSNLTANHSAVRIVTTFTEGGDRSTEARDIPALVARSPAAVGADVEAAPVVNGSHIHPGRRRGTGAEAGGRGRSSHA